MGRPRREETGKPQTVCSVYTLAARHPNRALRVGDVWIKGSHVWNVNDADKPDWVTNAERIAERQEAERHGKTA